MISKKENGDLIVSAQMPEDEWLIGYLLSFGTQVDIIEPAYLKDIVAEQAQKIYEPLNLLTNASSQAEALQLSVQSLASRHRTVINNLVNMACRITGHARKLVIGLGKSNARREVFQYVYYAFEDFVL